MSTINKQDLIETSRKAGEAILNIYNDPANADVVDYKADNSPLTLADQASHVVIDEALKRLYPDIPVISEEGDQLDYDKRKGFDTFWLVDPLDGTKEFIKKNGQFTVNIALIQGRTPIMGFVYTPVTDTLYYGIKGEGAYKVENGEESVLKVNNSTKDRIAVRSRSHAAEEEEQVLKSYGVVDSISVGSSLKFCMVAEGKADLYYRHGPTMEWDTAAGQAVAEAAGGKVMIETGPEPFVYNKENLLNTGFLCLGF